VTDRRIVLSLVAGAVLIVFGSQIAISAVVPEVWSPFPAATLLLLMSGLSRASIAVIVLLVYATACAVVVRPNGVRTRRPLLRISEIVIVLSLGALHMFYLVTTWQEGTLRFGSEYLHMVAGIGALMFVACCVALIATVRSGSLVNEIAVVTLVLLWLTTYAFPWTTELP
jgi:hypothetical protein